MELEHVAGAGCQPVISQPASGLPSVIVGETRVEVVPGAVTIEPGTVTFSQPAAVGKSGVEIVVNTNGEEIDDLADLLAATANALRSKVGTMKIDGLAGPLCSHCREELPR